MITEMSEGNHNAGRRLLVVGESLGIGGTETHLIRLLPPLAARGWDTTVYCITERGRRADQLEAAGIRVIGLPQPEGAPAPWAAQSWDYCPCRKSPVLAPATMASADRPFLPARPLSRRRTARHCRRHANKGHEPTQPIALSSASTVALTH